jgi:heme/copper-type cytochrome/quinol oxidase subunit 3
MFHLSTLESLNQWYIRRALRAPEEPRNPPYTLGRKWNRRIYRATGDLYQLIIAYMDWFATDLGAATTVRVIPVNEEDLRDLLATLLEGTIFPAEVEILTKRTHPFYIAPYSEYPMVLGFTLHGIMVANVHYLHHGSLGLWGNLWMALAAAAIFCWLQDLEELAATPSLYTPIVRVNLVAGVLLFIVSEVMVFFALFWAYLHSSLNPSPLLGAVWPPRGLEVLKWYEWPALSTCLLILSGCSANSSYYGLKANSPRETFTQLPSQPRVAPWPFPVSQRALLLFGVTLTAEDWLTEQERIFQTHRLGDWFHPWYATFATRGLRHVRLGFYDQRVQLFTVYGGLIHTLFGGYLFLSCQKHEYGHLRYCMADGNYATLFFALTGLHGLHVLAGLLLLGGGLGRFWRLVFLGDNVPHVGQTAGVWYWHFVDVVWVLLFGMVYVWGNSSGTPSPPPSFPEKGEAGWDQLRDLLPSFPVHRPLPVGLLTTNRACYS